MHHIVESIGFVCLSSSRLGLSGVCILRVWYVARHTKASVELLCSQFFIKFIKLAKEFTFVELDVI